MTKLALLLSTLPFLPLIPSFVIDKCRRFSCGLKTFSPRTFGVTLASLLPEENPSADPTKVSKSGVSYASVLQGLHELYPPSELAKRNAASRTDGYWPFIQKGQDPPQQLTYGEFDFYFFAELLDRAHDLFNKFAQEEKNGCKQSISSWNQKTFCDVGSGTGRLVLAAAALHPDWKLCRGIELLNSIHVLAEETLVQCRSPCQNSADVGIETKKKGSTSSSFVGEDDVLKQYEGRFVLNRIDDENGKSSKCEKCLENDDPIFQTDTSSTDCFLPSYSPSGEQIKLAPIDLVCGSFDDPNVYFGDADCVFVFSSCMSASIISSLSAAIGRQCKPGTIVITTEFPLDLEGMLDPSNDPDELLYSHCTYDGDFDDPEDSQEWSRFCAEEGIQSIPFKFDLLETIDGYCWLTGGISTAFIHRVSSSAWDKFTPVPPTKDQSLSDEELAAMAWMFGLKSQKKDFYRDVRNNMIFHGFAENWYKDLET